MHLFFYIVLKIRYLMIQILTVHTLTNKVQGSRVFKEKKKKTFAVDFWHALEGLSSRNPLPQNWDANYRKSTG